MKVNFWIFVGNFLFLHYFSSYIINMHYEYTTYTGMEMSRTILCNQLLLFNPIIWILFIDK